MASDCILKNKEEQLFRLIRTYTPTGRTLVCNLGVYVSTKKAIPKFLREALLDEEHATIQLSYTFCSTEPEKTR